MASTLLAAPCSLYLQNRKVGLTNFRSSFYGKLMYFRCSLGRKLSRSHGNHLVVASVLGRRKARTRETVIPDANYRIPIVLLDRCILYHYSPFNGFNKGLAGGLAYTDNLVPAVPVGLLGLLLLFQTTRVRFVFDDEALEAKVGDELQDSGENVFVGGKNRWKYSTFVDWELWWPNFPILVYFKEKQANLEGQIHFLPVIFNGKQLYDVMVERAGTSQNSGPK